MTTMPAANKRFGCTTKEYFSGKKGEHEHHSYKFLGFQFQPRTFKKQEREIVAKFQADNKP